MGKGDKNSNCTFYTTTDRMVLLARVLFCIGIVVVVGVFISIVLANMNNPISVFDLGKTSDFGNTFAGLTAPIIGLIGAGLTFAALYIQYEANQIQFNALKEQQFDATFFNYLNTHQLIYDRIQIRLDQIKKNIKEVQPNPPDHKEIFDALYFLLNERYKKREGDVLQKIEEFFDGNYYIIGGYIRGFMDIVEFVEKQQMKSNEKEKYISILLNSSTIDQLRILFYTIIWQAKDGNTNWKKLLNKYNFLDYLGNKKGHVQLIVPIDDKKAWEEI